MYTTGFLDLEKIKSEKEMITLVDRMIIAAITAKSITHYGTRLREIRALQADFESVKSFCHYRSWQDPMKDLKGAIRALEKAKEDRIYGLF